MILVRHVAINIHIHLVHANHSSSYLNAVKKGKEDQIFYLLHEI